MKTLSEFKALNKQVGNHFFDRDAMRFFNSRIESGLLKGKFFITSESDMRNTTRFFNVREAKPDGSVKTAIPFNTLRSKFSAKDCIKSLS